MRLKVTIEYAGTRYSGWQIQKNARTVQGELERAVREATGVREFEIYGSGRTDAGVHALGQIAHVDIDSAIPHAGARRSPSITSGGSKTNSTCRRCGRQPDAS